jgi:hypothetical protein
VTEKIMSAGKSLLDLSPSQGGHGTFCLLVRGHNHEASAPGGVVDSRQDDTVRYGAVLREKCSKLVPNSGY